MRSTDGAILVVNDHEWTARSIETLLASAGHRTVRAFTGAQLTSLLETEAPDALILDTQLPDVSSLDLLPQLKASGLIGPGLPVILTTAGPSGRSLRLRASEAGAWEFFGQPLDGGALLAKLQVFLAAYRANRPPSAEDLAPTGCYAGESLRHRAVELGALARRSGVPVSCLSLELPEGAPADEGRVAEAIRRVGRASDSLGRLGQGHYVVLAFGADEAGADRLAGRLREALDASSSAAGSVRIRRVRPAEPLPSGEPASVESLLAAAADRAA
jgi:CheY-like chemotaxis protein